MNKYSVNTYLKSPETTYTISIDYILALLPIIFWSIIRFKLTTAVIVSSCVFADIITDVVFKFLSKKKLTPPSLKSIYGALIFSLTLYPETSHVVAIVGAIILSILFNILNSEGNSYIFVPLVARVITFALMPKEFNAPEQTPYFSILNGMIPNESPVELFLGSADVTLGSLSIVAILLGGLYLIFRKSSDFRASSAYLLLSLILSLAFPIIKARGVESTLYELLSSEMLFITFFVLTDMQSTPKKKGLRYLKGALCALLTFTIKKINYTIDGFYIGIIVVDLLFSIICMISDKIEFAKECKNEQ